MIEERRDTIEEELRTILIGPDTELYSTNAVFYHGINAAITQFMLMREVLKTASIAYNSQRGKRTY